ncbi:MAG: family 43 glycosylhydrolase [Candidatus Izemoplasmatales bacterium]|nr:family 43 glycosylhydrolase [Candidatus Izemoplasmatales bacterium]
MKKQATNPFLPSYEYIPDGEPYVFGDRVYLFGSHDCFNGKTFCMNNYVCWSASVNDLSDWKYEGVIYDKLQDPLIHDNSRNMYAPDVQQGSDGRYYLYYFFDFSDIISVAVSDHPQGKYEFYGHVKYPDGTLLGKKKNDPFMFDPGVLVDNDHRVYLYTGFCPKLITRIFLFGRGKLDASYVTELEEDMLTVKVKPNRVAIQNKSNSENLLEGHDFFEASSIRKINDVYYFIYSSEKNHELCYATSPSPKGPFVYGGTIISNADIGLNQKDPNFASFYYGNNHGSITKIQDKWYVFYHRQTNRHEYSRQACAEKINIDNRGEIQQVEMTSCGLNGGPLHGKGIYSSHIACQLYAKKGASSVSPLVFFKSLRKHPYLTQIGGDREDNPNQYVANIRNESVVGYKYFNFSQLKGITIEITGKGEGKVEVYTDLNQQAIAEINVSVNHSPSTFSAKTVTLNDICPLYFKYVGKGYINLIRFTLTTD